MKYRMLDENGDMLPVTGQNRLWEGAQAVAGAVRSRILSFLGEWWETPDEGIPYASLFGRLSDTSTLVARALLQDRIGQTEGVDAVLSLEFQTDSVTRARTISAQIDTEYGEMTVEV